MGALLVGRAETDDGLAGDEGRAVRFLRGFDGSGDRIRIMAVDTDGVPVNRLETGNLVGAVGEANFAVDGDVVVIPEENELVKLQMAGKRDGFVADAFHEAAVAAQYISEVALQVGAELLFQLAFGDCHAHGVGDALAERTGGRFDAGGVAIFRMASGL